MLYEVHGVTPATVEQHHHMRAARVDPAKVLRSL
jgi:hypothetical protein